ncbi:uncharacterized protein LOC110443553 [Mizuhopecten yessoensis]|uniref:uncharacterized protein LOC110443553 n=1 Tax=Mizuhopecten yessoensis TaxID=6573 RepID=UPI000B45E549|nr:uncharacterized protein LOC110443553 [Mizuhopecten yessoensis]
MALQEDDVIIPNLIAQSDHDEKSDEESNYDKDGVQLSPKQHRKIDPGFLPNDVVLVIEDEHLHVNKALLESASPVFAAWLKKDCTARLGYFHLPDETLDTVLPLADEYRTEKLITECVEVIRQRVESVSEADIYIPPSRVVTYLRWIDQYNLHTGKEYVVRLASYLKTEDLEDEPGYENIALQLKLEISNARAKLLASLFVSKVTEAKERIYEFKIPHSSCYLAEWKQNVAKLVEDALASPISEKSTWPKTTAYRNSRKSYYSGKSQISLDILVSLACLDICDRFKFSESYIETLKRIKSLRIGKADFKLIWSTYYSTDVMNASMERYSLEMCECELSP